MIYIKSLKCNFNYIFAILIFILSIVCQTGCNATQNVSGSEQQIDTNLTESKLMKVNYIDVGQADSILIQSPNGKNMLIDAGETKENAVLNYLNNCGIKKLDVVIATHPHNDHISEMSKVIDTFDIGEFYMPKKQHTTKSFERMIDSLSSKNIKLKEAKAGVSVDFDSDTKCEIVAPCKNNYGDLNNWSAVVKISFGNNSFIFTGDAESLSENEIISSGADIQADVLKVGHHGSHSSTSKAFLEKVSPKYAVISAGKENDYGHPHKETLDILNKYGVKIFGTYDSGNVVAVSDGENISFNVGNTVQQNDTDISKEQENIINNYSSQSTGSTQGYIGNKNTKKLHNSECSKLPSEKNRVLFTLKEEALNQGYTLCGICKP